jgi:hypothetical protein
MKSKDYLLCLLLLIIMAVLFFMPLLLPQNLLFTTDDNAGNIVKAHNLLPGAFLAFWSDHSLLGVGGNIIPITATSVLELILPPFVFVNWIHAIYLVFASFMLFNFLRLSSLNFFPAFLGGLIFAWLGSNFTLTYAGHIPKFAVLAFAASYLFFLKEMELNKSGWEWAVFAGLSLGLMFAEQQDVALFFSVILAPYTLLKLFQMKVSVMKKLVSFGLIPVVALLFMAPALFASFMTNVAGVAANDEEEDKQARWEFATQWSWPPEESIDFVAPGYMGWRSGELEGGPYWGRMGRSAGWEKTRQGFMNFKLENQYIGIVPVFFAIIAIVVLCPLYFSSRRNSYNWICDEWGVELIFWSVALLISLVLSFGKYFPLYYIFYQLPLVNSIRNPNKFLQVFQLILAILSAYGFEAILRYMGDVGVAKKKIEEKV